MTLSAPSLSPTATIGFVGLGLLGQAMALRLAQHGFALVVWNREPERSAALAAAGAVVAGSPHEVARQCTTVCVIDGGAVRDVFRPRGLAHVPRAPRTIIGFSRVDPAQSRAIAALAAQSGFS